MPCVWVRRIEQHFGAAQGKHSSAFFQQRSGMVPQRPDFHAALHKKFDTA
jgi:hypothetical protein